MEKRFSISEAARMAGMTSETLRHYDRTGLVKPSYTDAQTGYRYYSPQEIVRLGAVQALKQMDIPLGEIGKLLDCNSVEEIIARLKAAEARADERIAQLTYARERIRRARADYERRADDARESADPQARRHDNNQAKPAGMCVRELPARTILLSDTMRAPTLDNLWDYQRPFFSQLPPGLRDSFSFEDMAGIYEHGSASSLFAVCMRYVDVPGLIKLPAGRYLCADCTEDDREQVRAQLTEAARAQGGAPDFALQLVVLTGILQWKYQVQVFLGAAGD